MIPISIELKEYLSKHTDEEIIQVLNRENKIGQMTVEWWMNYIAKLRKEK